MISQHSPLAPLSISQPGHSLSPDLALSSATCFQRPPQKDEDGSWPWTQKERHHGHSLRAGSSRKAGPRHQSEISSQPGNGLEAPQHTLACVNPGPYKATLAVISPLYTPPPHPARRSAGSRQPRELNEGQHRPAPIPSSDALRPPILTQPDSDPEDTEHTKHLGKYMG